MRPHVETRLASRASPAAVDRGFLLLRDRAALVAFIARLGDVGGAFADADRIGFALGPGDDAATAVVARDGAGVTCLGPGMVFSGPVVAWPAVAAYLQATEAAFAARRALHQVKDVDDDVSPLLRITSQPHRLVRADWDLVRALSPLLGLQVHVKTLEGAVAAWTLLSSRAVDATGDSGAELWRAYVAGHVALTLIGDQRGAEQALVAAVATNDVLLATRGLWYLANQPETTLAFVEEQRGDFKNPLARLVIGRVLAVLGFRNPAFARDAARLRQVFAPDDDDSDDDGDRTRAFAAAATPILLSPLRLVSGGTNDDAWARDMGEMWRPFALARMAPRVVPRGVSSFTDVDDASVTLWRTALLTSVFPPLVQLSAARLFSLAPLEAFLPTDVVDPLLRISHGLSYFEHCLPMIVAAATPEKVAATPAKAPPKTPPNAPCPCGSGKKWKKCHGKA